VIFWTGKVLSLYSCHMKDAHSLFSPAFPQILHQMREWDAEFSELDPAFTGRFEIMEDRIIFDNNSVPLTQQSRNRLFEKARAPFVYLSERAIDVQILALRDHFRQQDFGAAPKFVLRNGELFTLVRSQLIELNLHEVVAAVGEALGADADNLNVSRIDYKDGRLDLDFVSPARTIELRRDDIVQAGLHIEHVCYGDCATQIHSYVYRLVCENGMTRRECSPDGIVRIRKLSVSHPRGKELLLDQIRRLTTRTWQTLEPQLLELRNTSDRRADVPHLLRQWVQRARISPRTTNGEMPQTVMDRLLRAWRAEGAESSYYAAVNALTWVASHDQELSPRQRRVLSLLGGLLAFSGVHICPRCFSVLSGPSQTGDEHVAEAESTTGDVLS